MARSGSTVQYQITYNIVEFTGGGITLGWINELNQTVLKALDNAIQRGEKLVVVKSHHYTDPVAALVRTDKARAVYVYRDLRDVAVSLGNKFHGSIDEVFSKGSLSIQLNNYYRWTSLEGILISQYESMINDLHQECLKIASYLNIKLDHCLAREITDKLQLERQIKKIEDFDVDNLIRASTEDFYDPVSQLHNEHINSGKIGQWKDSLSTEQLEYIENLAFSWLVDRRYPLSTIQHDQTKTSSAHGKGARQLLSRNQCSEAEIAYKQAILGSPNIALNHYGLGTSYLKQGKVDEAINAYRHAIYLNPNSALANHGLGEALSQTGKPDQAAIYYRRAIKIKPKEPRFEKSLNLALSRHN